VRTAIILTTSRAHTEVAQWMRSVRAGNSVCTCTAGILTTSPVHTEVASTEPESVTPAPMVVLAGAEILTVGVALSASCCSQQGAELQRYMDAAMKWTQQDKHKCRLMHHHGHSSN